SGTYNLPEAQLDRFLLKTIIDYPTEKQEISVMKQYSKDNNIKIEKILNKTDIKQIKIAIEDVFVDENIYEYVKDIVFATRNQKLMDRYLSIGASPRASIALIKTSKILAYLDGRDFVLPEDIKEMALPVLRHRIILSYEAVAEGITTDTIIEEILKKIKLK
ncbi:MAG: MoxR family ATPase, partial [Candidatus Gracilibacteria bacterium]|nr:MoxR family ATPase [Candidatus Gracilibacteria bacterium]